MSVGHLPGQAEPRAAAAAGQPAVRCAGTTGR